MLGFLQERAPHAVPGLVQKPASIWRMTVHWLLEWGFSEQSCGVIPEMHLINHTFNYSVLTALTSYLIGPNQLRDFEVNLYGGPVPPTSRPKWRSGESPHSRLCRVTGT
ncbi:hypothetical protein MRX96_021809 [Rhipicephalus microplus]